MNQSKILIHPSEVHCGVLLSYVLKTLLNMAVNELLYCSITKRNEIFLIEKKKKEKKETVTF